MTSGRSCRGRAGSSAPDGRKATRADTTIPQVAPQRLPDRTAAPMSNSNQGRSQHVRAGLLDVAEMKGDEVMTEAGEVER